MAKLPAGDYWIGDPRYALNNRTSSFDWNAFTDYFYEGGPKTGVGTYQGITFAVYITAKGHGIYEDGLGNTYGVDKELLGCIPKEHVKRGNFGAFHAFPEEFETGNDNGLIYFGDIKINTK